MTLTLPVLWRRYAGELRIERGAADRTVSAYETAWNSFTAHARALGWRLKVAEDLTYERLMEWQLNLKEVGKKEWTCRTYLMALKGFSRWLNVHGYARTDPGARFRTPRLKRVVPVLPPFAELEATLALEPSGRNRAIIAMALYGGLRAEEIRNIKRGSFVADQGLIGFVGKGRKQRSVALPPQALKLITTYLASNGTLPKPSDPLIRKEDGSGDGLSYDVINRVVTRWTKRHLGVRLTPHKLRHAMAGSASTSAWTSASSPKRSATSRWNQPRSTRRCPSSGRGESPSYFAPPGTQLIRGKTPNNINHFPQVYISRSSCAPRERS